MLTAVTEEGGTGVEAAIPGVRVAGKTGTAQKANLHARGYDPDRWVSSFVGFAPAERPRLAITVIIDEPQLQHSGAAIAGRTRRARSACRARIRVRAALRAGTVRAPCDPDGARCARNRE